MLGVWGACNDILPSTVPESDARSVGCMQRHPSFNGAGKRCSECGVHATTSFLQRCRKAMLGVWGACNDILPSTVPESDARSVGCMQRHPSFNGAGKRCSECGVHATTAFLQRCRKAMLGVWGACIVFSSCTCC